ncbi:bifunctional glycosyltransferase/CDP-glycerol:glycerophosphate glycerophosphotransferase [Streptomyces sp. NPDC002577]
MPRFTVIVPTHGVPGQLSDCLSSVLDQTFGDFELIAVVSEPDGVCAPIVGTYGDRDSRVRTVHSPADGGLPAARNAGIAAAQGEYLVFLDGDDTLVPDALRTVGIRLDATGDPDLLVFDHERVHWLGGGQGPVLEHLLAGAPQEAFSLARHRALPDPLIPAWSAAYRRDFVTRHELAFPPGMFTDRAWSVLAALHADRIAVLDRVCVRHLVRRQGARPSIAGIHHLDLLDQFERVMQQAGELKPPPEVLDAVFHRLVQEILKTAAHPGRLPSGALRRRFFGRAARLYRLHRPKDLRLPGGSLGVQHRLLAAGAYTAFHAMRRMHHSGTLPTVARTGRKRGAGKEDPHSLLYQSYLKQPVDENLAVFSAYWGRGYACNPAAVHAAAARLAPHLDLVFLVSEKSLPHMPDGVECAVIGTPRYWEVMARAKYAINNVNFEQAVCKRPGTVHLQTQHGTPLKRMGLETSDYPAASSSVSNHQNMLRRVARWDFNLSSNRHSTEIWERAFPGRYETLEYGYPRNDAFYTATLDDVRRVRRRLGVPDDRVAVLYAPTFRDYRSSFDARLDLASFCDELADEFVVLLRAHHSHEGLDVCREAIDSGKLIDLTGHRSPEEVCLAADALITDYSSIMFDYANLDRPLVVFAPDWDVYRDTRGVYFDLLTAPPGPAARDQRELTEIFRSGEWAGERSARLRTAFRERFCEFDDGRAAERVVRRVLLGEPPEAVPPVVPLHQRTPAPSAGPVPVPVLGGPAVLTPRNPDRKDRILQ